LNQTRDPKFRNNNAKSALNFYSQPGQHITSDAEIKLKKDKIDDFLRRSQERDHPFFAQGKIKIKLLGRSKDRNGSTTSSLQFNKGSLINLSNMNKPIGLYSNLAGKNNDSAFLLGNNMGK
jgi:hypothetical protein